MRPPLYNNGSLQVRNNFLVASKLIPLISLLVELIATTENTSFEPH